MTRELLAGIHRPESRLLLLAARVNPDRQVRTRIRGLVTGDIDWVRVIRVALRHGVLPLVSHTLQKVCPGLVGRDTLFELRRHYENYERGSRVLTQELARLIHGLNGHGVEAIPYKGPVLAAMAYGDVALREFCDLDILVCPADVAGAAAVLRSLGYAPRRELDQACVRGGSDWPFYNTSGSRVKLHWAILPRRFHFRADLSGAWSRLARVEAGGVRFPSLAAEDLLPILAAHGARHCWARLNWVCNIAELVRAHPGMNWPGVWGNARRRGAERLVSLALVLASGVLEAALPEEAARRAWGDRGARLLATEVCEAYFASLDDERPIARPELFFARARERWRDRLAITIPVAVEVLRSRMRARGRFSLSAVRPEGR